MKQIFTILVLAALGAVGYFGWQYWDRAPDRAAAEILAAVQANRYADIAKHIDSPTLQARLVPQLETIYAARHANAIAVQKNLIALKEGAAKLWVMASHPEYLTAPDSPAAKAAIEAEAARLAGPPPVMLEPREDAEKLAARLSAPDGLGDFIRQACSDIGIEIPTGAKALATFTHNRMVAQSDGTYALELRPDMIGFLVKDKTSSLIFARDGYFRWELIDIRLPKDGRPAVK